MRLISFFARRYPWQSLLVLIGLLAASALGAVGLSAALPLASLAATGGQSGGDPSPLEAAVASALGLLGLAPTPMVLIPVVALAFLLKAPVVIAAMRLVGYTVAQIATDLRIEVLRALSAARWGYFTRQPAGAAANAIATEADRASRAYLEISHVLAYSVEATAYMGLALAVSWRATLVTAAAGAISSAALNALVRMTSRAGRKQTILLKSLLGRLTDALQAVKLLKATGNERLLGPLLEADARKLNRALRRQVLSKELLRALQEPILVWIALGIFAVSLGVLQMPFAEIAIILFLFLRSMDAINKTQRRWQHVAGDASALWSLRETIERAEAHREELGGGREPRLERGVELRDVWLRYDDRDVLASLSLEIPARSITAIVGASGAGKTTLVDLVTGLVRPDAGEIRVDGVPLAELDLRRWRQLLGYVPQEMLMLHDTIRANVTLDDPALSDADVVQALRDAGAWEFVAELPDGLDSSVGERGALLSGGQRQRIAIARAVAHRPRLLIFDEATASLDPETEAAVWATVEKLKSDAAVVAISHQPAVTQVADRIYRIQDGRAERVERPRRNGAREVA